MKKSYSLSCILLLIFALSANNTYAYTYTRPSRATILAALNAQNPNFEHPRLYARSADFVTLRQKVVSDPIMASWYTKFLATADRYVNIDIVPPSYRQKNLTIIQNSYLNSEYTRPFSEKILTLSLAYQITGQQKYADRAYREMDSLNIIPDWTSTKYGYELNTADIMWGFAVAYDWCYAAFTPAQRTILKANMVNKGINKLLAMYAANPTYIINPVNGNPFSDGNHNPWDNGGASVAALVIGDEEPIVAGELLEKALVVVENFTKDCGTYGFIEGPGYGNGALSYYMEWMAAMESALGTSYNYINAPGLTDLAYFSPYNNGPVKSLNYHDAGTDAKNYLKTTFFIANKVQNPALGNMRKADLVSGNTSPNVKELLWYKPDYYGTSTEVLALDKYFAGYVHTGSFRTSFSDPNALFLAFHGGENYVGHRHLDTGQFNIDAMGLNWALDLGTEPLTYNAALRSVYTSSEWLYRINPGGHNTLLIDPSTTFYGQSSSAYSPIINSDLNKSTGGFAIMDMTMAYQTQVNSAIRGYALTDNRSRIIIQDEIVLKQSSVLWWNMHTRASITVNADGKTAILSQSGKRMRATIVSPSGASFLSMKAEPLPEMYQNSYQTLNIGIQKLAIKLTGVQKTTIMVEFVPILNDSDLTKSSLPLIPLINWSEPRLTTNISPTITYATPNVYVTNTAITPLTPTNTGGIASSYSISPTLPMGLNFNTSSGIISGTPTKKNAATDYSVTATNSYGSFTTVVNIRATNIVPPNISYPTSKVFALNSAIASITPTNTGAPIPTTPFAIVTTVANVGGQAQGLAVNSAGTILYAPLSQAFKVNQITLPSTVSLLAGSGVTGSADGAGAAAQFSQAFGVAVHPLTGDIFVADATYNVIKKITAAGVVSTYAGLSTTAVSSVDGAATTTARFYGPRALAFDEVGNLYVSQTGNGAIRKISADGTTVSTIVKNGTITYFTNPWGLAYSNGYLYVSEVSGHKISKIYIETGAVSVLAGSGTAGSDDGVGTAASFNGPRGVAVDAEGNVYVADYNNHRIRKITTDGSVTTFAGSGVGTVSTDGIGVAATFRSPAGLALDGMGNLYVGDAGSQNIRKVVLTGYSISPTLPAGLAFDATTGTISGTPTAITSNTDYTITATNGGGQSQSTIAIRTSTMISPIISYSVNSITYYANMTSNITPLIPTNTGGAIPTTTYGTVSTIANLGGQVQGLAFNANKSIIYTALSNTHQLKKITLPSAVSTLAGSGLTTPFADGANTAATFNGLYGVAVHPITGDIYVADVNNHRIRKITTAGIVTTFAGTGVATSLDGVLATATINAPRGLVFDTDGTMYILQSNAIRKIDAAATTISTISNAFTNGTNAWNFSLYNGYFYVSETSGCKIDKVSLADGSLSVLAGSGTAGSADEQDFTATFNGPRGIAVDNTGYVYVVDYGNNKIRRISPEGLVTTIAGSGTNATTDGIGLAAAFRSPAGATLDGLGNLYVGDAASSNIRKVIVSGCTISPALPTGLSFDPKTGIISGKPTLISPSTDYTITAFNGDGSSSTVINITINSLTSNALINDDFNGKLNCYYNGNGEIIVNGDVSKLAMATLYDIQGRALLSKNMIEGNHNSISIPNSRNGFYMLFIKDHQKSKGFKILINN